MRIEDVALGEQIEITENRTLVVTRPIYIVRAPCLPYTKPDFLVGFIVKIKESERHEKINLRVQFVNPAGEVVFKFHVKDVIAQMTIADRSALRGAMVGGCEIDFYVPGIYGVQIVRDKMKLKAVNFEVVAE
jgi:hypothetical protein